MTSIPQGFSLAGRKALVTGTSGGLGRHYARVLAVGGASVVQRCASIDALAGAMQDLDILVNNAGIARAAMALNQSEAQWDEVLDTNLKGLFFVAQAAGRATQKHRSGGSIIKAMLQRISRRRLGRLQDLNGPLLLLASDASAYMTGTVVTVDGGHLVSGL
jgi:NAD(P)-dependent dehydrogenase (short-subunit alcohol dehydrogenase family)